MASTSGHEPSSDSHPPNALNDSSTGHVADIASELQPPVAPSPAIEPPTTGPPAAASPPAIAMPVIPNLIGVHDQWDPKYQAVAKCDFCHSRNSSDRAAGVLQLCQACKMSICQDCCLEKHSAGKRRLEAVQQHGKTEQLTEAQIRWCQFSVQANHILDPQTVNWEVPAKKTRQPRAAAKKTNASKSKVDTQAKRGARALGRGGTPRQPPKRGRSRLSISQTPSDFITSPEDDDASYVEPDDQAGNASLDGNDDENGFTSQSPRAPKRKRERSRIVSPDYRAAEEAADALATLSASPVVDNHGCYKRLKTSHPTEPHAHVPAPPYPAVAHPQPPPPQLAPLSHILQNRPSLPPLDSICPSWRGTPVPRGSESYGPSQRQAADVMLDTRGRIIRESSARPPPSYATFDGYHTQSRQSDDFSSRRYSYPNTPQRVDNHILPYSYSREERRRFSGQEYPSAHQNHDHEVARVPYPAPYPVQDHAPPTPNAYNAPTTAHSSPRTAPQQPQDDITRLAQELQAEALAAHAASPDTPLDECLARELARAWPHISARHEDRAHGFRVLLGAAHIIILRYRLAHENAAHIWLHDMDRRLSEGGAAILRSQE